MGALALPSRWIPEDDLLLKNAIEGGASLESLAKGAVQFSRRFTIKELRARWFALLYDPAISTKAAEQMVELERSATNLPSKSNRIDSSKANKISSGKRKAESVRRCYYARRKRVCHDTLNDGDLSYLVGPGDACFLNGPDAPVSNNVLGDPMVSQYGLEHNGFDDLHNVFPQVVRRGAQSCGVSEYPIERHHNALGDHMEANNMLTNNMVMKEIPGHNVFEGNDIQPNQMCSRFEGNTIFNPTISDCETSFDHLHYTSPMPALPDWKAIEGLSVSEMANDVTVRGKTITTGDTFVIPNNSDTGRQSDYDVMHVEPELNNHIACDDLKISTGCPDGFLEELSESLFNFGSEDDEMLVIDGGGKKYLDSITTLLLDSPNDVSEERLPNMLEVKEPATEEVCIEIPSSTALVEKNDTVDTHLGDVNPQNTSDTPIPTSAECAINSEFLEFCNGDICCTLNMEDPEIPSNDDVFPSKLRPSSLKRTQGEAKNSSLHGKENAGIQSSGKGHTTLKKEQRRCVETNPASQTQIPDVGLSCAVDELGVKYESPRAETNNETRHTSISYGGPCQSLQAVKIEHSELPLSRQHLCSVSEKPSADIVHLQSVITGPNQDGQASSAQRNQDLQALGPVDCMPVEPDAESYMSDVEEQFSEHDTDIPYFSDVESMILEMDLGPEDQDSFYNKEVAKYQLENMKRVIIRLEQNAHSYMQRALASHAAFAILYGRHSKHYIKKAEVLLGRATDDVPVDIDLGREGRANKISRRQAIIKMDKDGVFNMKNTGKCSIYVNSKEICPGHNLALQSNCLIEIRGMPFIFETNEARIKQYLDKLADKKPHI